MGGSCRIGEVCTVGGPRTLCLFINWTTRLKRLRIHTVDMNAWNIEVHCAVNSVNTTEQT